MKKKLVIIKVIGFIMMIEGALMLLPMIIAFLYHEDDWKYFLFTGVASAAVGTGLFAIRSGRKNIHALEGYLIVALAWVVLSAVAAVPFVISGSIPNYLNALFETVSGFTTSGVTAMPDVEVLSYSMQFWRCFTHWIGGMGILVFMLAISPVVGGGSAIHMLRAESPGPITEKISPRISTTAKYLYLIYFAFTLIEVLALSLAKLPVYNAFLLSFGTMATGGFSYLNSSVAALTFLQRDIITIFMFLAGVNFSLYFLAVTGKALTALKNEELRWYVVIYVVSVLLITCNTFFTHTFTSLREAVHHALFAVASIVTTTGFASCDMDLWPWFSKNLILAIMFFGACAGSTAGGLKISRIAIAFKHVRNGLKNIMHPRGVNTIRFNGKDVSVDVVRGVSFYILLFVVLYAASMLIICLDPRADFTTAFSAVNTTINNNGVAFEGAAGSFYTYRWYSKIVFILDMLIGRLEIYPVMALFGMIFAPALKVSREVKKRIRSRY